jgi:hypothetical protein
MPLHNIEQLVVHLPGFIRFWSVEKVLLDIHGHHGLFAHLSRHLEVPAFFTLFLALQNLFLGVFLLVLQLLGSLLLLLIRFVPENSVTKTSHLAVVESTCFS